MQIIYFTTSIHESDYPEFQKNWKVSLNPSNQNFHNKLIRSLGKIATVEVFSLRPFSRSRCRIKKLKANSKIAGTITYHYLEVSINPLFRYTSFLMQSRKLLKGVENLNMDDAIIMADTINPKTIKVANSIGKKYSIPVIGICTDSPSNITGTKRSYTVNLLNQSKNLDGYIALTKSLGELFNVHNKPSLVFEGLVEDRPFLEKSNDRSYFFFGGALLPRYGIYELINAFKKIQNCDVELLICGHHFDLKELHESIKDDKRISFLGILTVEDVLRYEAGAIANINPRPFSEDLDRFSIPSKTLEYLYSGRPTISVRNTILQQHFSDDAIWCKSASEKDLQYCMEKVLSMSEEERVAIGKKAQQKVIELYSLNSISEIIKSFLAGFSN
ncbi:MAG TPA: glycosyltransferase [Bacilli bacterium]|nr:glycosyltransferase [Bacilli bacterium]HPS19009.1 glycosyltransferase [Bacilli bacterium]